MFCVKNPESMFSFGMRNNLPWWPSCLDHGAQINVDAPGCCTSVV